MKNFRSIFENPIPGRAVVFFGAGEIATRTAKKFGKPSWSVDNSPSLWGGSFGEITDIRQPDSISEIAERVTVVICSSAEDEIRLQLGEFGVQDSDIVLSPYAKSMASPSRLSNLQSRVLVASGGPASLQEGSGGGLYEVIIDAGIVTQRKVFSASCHGITEGPNNLLLVSTDEGVITVDPMTLKTKNISQLPAGFRPHGLAWNPQQDFFHVVGNSRDAILRFGLDGTHLSTHYLLRGKEENNIALHHMNDIAYSNGALYVSMFSFSGSWKSGSYDGGIYAFDADTLEAFGPVVSHARMPHSVTFSDDELWFCNSLPGLLTKGDRDFELAFPTFARGLDFVDDLSFVGASRNRNATDASFKSGAQIREISSGFFVTVMGNGLSRFVKIEGNIPEIHAVKLLPMSK